ncbi:MAG: hypothetical protein PHW02_05490 [bacterium]|nr:hypothetical protein [bacterium]
MKRAIAALLLASLGINLFPYEEGLFDCSSQIDSFSSQIIERNSQQYRDIIEKNNHSDIFFDLLKESTGEKTLNKNKSDIKSYYEAGKYNDAVVQKAADYTESYLKGLSFIKLKMWSEAINQFTEARRSGNSKMDSICFIAEAACRLNMQDYSVALNLVKTYNDDYSLLIKAIAYISKSHYDSVIEILSIVESERIEPDRSYLLLSSYYRKKDFSNVIKTIERFEKKYPYVNDILELKYLKGQMQYEKGYFKRSIMSLQDVILDSDSNSALLGNAYYLTGKNYFMLGDYDKMEEYLYFAKMETSLSDFKKNAEFLDGKGFFLKGDYVKASGKLTAFTKKYPDDELSQYAYQLLSQSFFYLKKYKKSAEYMSLIKTPSLFADKLVMMKYFIDYKSGAYKDSISAYMDFLAKESQNPMRREAYELIIRESSSDSQKIWSFQNLAKEFPESENLYSYAVHLAPLIVKECSIDEIMKITAVIRKNQEKKFETAFLVFLRELRREEDYRIIIELYSKYAGDLDKSKPQAAYIAALSLREMNNIDGALFMLKSISMEDDEFSDSAAVSQASIYSEMHDAAFLKKFIEEAAKNRNPHVEGELYKIYGEKLARQKNHKEAKEAFLKSADLFKDDRNMAALSLLSYSDECLLNQEKSESIIYAEKALLLATDIEVQNKIRLHLEALK